MTVLRTRTAEKCTGVSF